MEMKVSVSLKMSKFNLNNAEKRPNKNKQGLRDLWNVTKGSVFCHGNSREKKTLHLKRRCCKFSSSEKVTTIHIQDAHKSKPKKSEEIYV